MKPLVTGHGHKTTFQNDFLNQGTRDDSSYCVVPDAVKFYNDIGGYVSKNKSTMLTELMQLCKNRLEVLKRLLGKSNT